MDRDDLRELALIRLPGQGRRRAIYTVADEAGVGPAFEASPDDAGLDAVLAHLTAGTGSPCPDDYFDAVVFRDGLAVAIVQHRPGRRPIALRLEQAALGHLAN